MRAIFVAMLLALGIGLIGTSGSIAAPANGIAIGEAIGITDSVTQVQHWRFRSGGHWRFGSRGPHWRWGSRGGGRGERCHLRGSSRLVLC